MRRDPVQAEAVLAKGATPEMRGFATGCPCPKTRCERHGDCRACVDHHAPRRLPRCER